MRGLQTVAGVQTLRSITARSSSARVLDLHTLAQDCAGDPAHRERPMFTHPLLNRTIIVKHHPRPGEFEYAPARAAIATKVIFPFDPDDLDLGGQFLMVDEPDLAEQLGRHLDYSGAQLERDVAVLRLLDGLPTLDPFLLYEALTANRLDVAPCYYRLSHADKTEMLEFVCKQVESLIALCFGGPAGHDGQAKRLSELLLAEGDSEELEPLRATMRMEEAEFSHAMFCWKAVLYYRWRSRKLAPEIKATHKSIKGVEAGRFETDVRPFVRNAVSQLDRMIGECERKIAEMFRTYDGVFKALTVQRSPEPFRRFLTDGPRHFSRLGERMGRLEQLISFWAHQFPELRTRQLSPEAIFDGLRNILSALSLKSGFAESRRSAEVWDFGDLEVSARSRRPEWRRAS